MNYQAWDVAIQDAIRALPELEATTRSQKFIKQFPDALTQFRAKLGQTTLEIPLADFQKHPTFLLRWLLAQWKDEDAKVLRTDLTLIMSKSAALIQNTQAWRAGRGDCWKTWGFKNMDDMYNNLETPPEEAAKLQSWFFQRFYGLDASCHPVHFELLPATYEADLILPLSIRRIVNNEHTLRHRVPLLNPSPESVRNDITISPESSKRADVLSNPILGATWVLDARKLSLWYGSAIYKTASALIEHSNSITAAHYPEQGYRAVVVNLGAVLGTMYNMLMKVMPATTQATTRCYIGNQVLEEVMGGWANVPEMFRNSKVTGLTAAEEKLHREDLGPFDIHDE